MKDTIDKVSETDNDFFNTSQNKEPLDSYYILRKQKILNLILIQIS